MLNLSPIRAAQLSLVVGLAVFGLKWLAYSLTGSVALYSDALESIINVLAALAAWWAIRVSVRPPDSNHPYGHTKAEYFSAVLEGVLIVLAALAIVNEAWHRLWDPQPAQAGLGLWVALAASGLNGLLAWLLLGIGKRNQSIALQADGRHVLSDVVTSVGVLIGVSLAWLTGWWVLDPLLALLVAFNILLTGWNLVRESVGGLMDEGLSLAEVAGLERLINDLKGEALEVHDLKTRRAGPRVFLEFHLVVPGHLTVNESHFICDRIEEQVRSKFAGAILTIHVEPDWKAKHKGRVL
jgi:cation diffusion facilitator family transporter